MSEADVRVAPKRSTTAGAAQFLEALDDLGFSKADLVRFMIRNGDDRSPGTIDRSIYRMAKGESRISGEMRVLLTLLRNGRAGDAN